MAAGSVDDTSWREDERHGVFEIPIEVPLRRRTSFAGHSKTRLLSPQSKGDAEEIGNESEQITRSRDVRVWCNFPR